MQKERASRMSAGDYGLEDEEDDDEDEEEEEERGNDDADTLEGMAKRVCLSACMATRVWVCMACIEAESRYQHVCCGCA